MVAISLGLASWLPPGDAPPEARGVGEMHVGDARALMSLQIYQSWLDKSTPHTAVRWVATLGLTFVYMIRVYLLQVGVAEARQAPRSPWCWAAAVCLACACAVVTAWPEAGSRGGGRRASRLRPCSVFSLEQEGVSWPCGLLPGVAWDRRPCSWGDTAFAGR